MEGVSRAKTAWLGLVARVRVLWSWGKYSGCVLLYIFGGFGLVLVVFWCVHGLGCVFVLFMQTIRFITIHYMVLAWRKIMAMQKATIGTILAIVVISLTATAISALLATRTVSNSGSITAVGVGVYSNSNCTTVLASISWGIVNPGGTATYTMYVKNTGDVQETLNMTTSGWNPASASTYIAVTWNQQGSVLAAGQVVAAVVTLTVASSISGVTNFNFNMTITGTH